MPLLSPSAVRERLAEREAAILDGVVRIHFQIAVAFQLQINHGVFGKQREHVVKKRDAGFDGGFALAVEVEADGDSGFVRVARDF